MTKYKSLLIFQILFFSLTFSKTFLIQVKENNHNKIGKYEVQDNELFGIGDRHKSVNAWLNTVKCLEPWEKNLWLGDLNFDTTAKSECARARFTIGRGLM